MNKPGTVEAIHIAPEAESQMQAKKEVDVVAERGVRGDRYFKDDGTFSDSPRGGLDITLTEAEAIEGVRRETGISLGFDEHRRNVTTRDTALNHLVGERFRLGDAVCEGVRLCEPCGHLQSLTADGIGAALTHRGGLRADVIEDGTVRVGDSIEPLDSL